mgnify:CR=1 FL=1
MNISVVIPTFNRGNFIRDTIKSVQNQTCKVDEIIVIDDGSTDNTKQLIKDLDIRYIYQNNQGVSSARNTGIRESKNDWIAFLDSDDIWEKNKIEKHITFHMQNKDILLSHTDELWVRNGKIINQKKHQQKPSGFCFLDNIPSCKIGPSTVLIHKKIFNDLGYFDEKLAVCEDYDLWLRVSKKYEIGYIDEKLIIKQAGHDNQLSFTTFAIDTYRITALEKHLESIYEKEIKEEIIKKCNLILKGAYKHNNEQLVLKYEGKLNLYK